MEKVGKLFVGTILGIILGLLTQLVLNWIPPTRAAVETLVSTLDGYPGGGRERTRFDGYAWLFIATCLAVSGLFPFVFGIVALSESWAKALVPKGPISWLFFALVAFVGVQNVAQLLIAPEEPKACLAWACIRPPDASSPTVSAPPLSPTTTVAPSSTYPGTTVPQVGEAPPPISIPGTVLRIPGGTLVIP